MVKIVSKKKPSYDEWTIFSPLTDDFNPKSLKPQKKVRWWLYSKEKKPIAHYGPMLEVGTLYFDDPSEIFRAASGLVHSGWVLFTNKEINSEKLLALTEERPTGICEIENSWLFPRDQIDKARGRILDKLGTVNET